MRIFLIAFLLAGCHHSVQFQANSGVSIAIDAPAEAASHAPAAPQIGPGTNSISSTAPYQVTLNYQNKACTSANLCLLQVQRSLCKTATSCPPNWVNVSYVTSSVTPTATGTTWIVIDKDPSLTSSSTYFYRASNSFTTSPTIYSPYSQGWKGTTNATSTPAAPTVGANNSVH